MKRLREMGWTRRRIIRSAGTAAAIGLAMPAIATGLATAKTDKLRILRWKNFVPASETWFNDVFVEEWSRANNVEVVVDNVGLGDINRLAAAEVKAQEGHDLVLFVSSRAALEDHVVDHRDIIEECESTYGPMPDAVRRSCFNPITDKYYGFVVSTLPAMVTYRSDLWNAVGKVPHSWDDVRKGGRAIKLLHDSPTGLSLAPEHNAKHSLRALLYSFGGFVQNMDGQVALNSKNSVEAVKFAKALYEEAMTEEVLSWTPPSNNQFMLAGNGNLTIDTMSIIRAAENTALPVEPDLSLALLPEGPDGRLGPMFGLINYVIWKFARNQDNAKRFLVDYIGAFRGEFLAGGYQNMPVYPGSVPDMADIIRNDGSSGRYDDLLAVSDTLTNIGHPGYSNAAVDEVVAQGLIASMFANGASGRMTPEDAVEQTTLAVNGIFEKWREAGKI